MEALWQDLRYGARMLAKQPGFTIVAVLTLALGIGAATAVFSVINAVLLQPLPYGNASRLALIWMHARHDGWRGPYVSGPDLVDFREQSQAFDAFAAADPGRTALIADGKPEELQSIHVSPNFFSTLGAQLALGRAFTPDEGLPDGPNVVILSHPLWQGRFGGDRAILGKAIQLGDEPHTVVGVTATNFRLYVPPELGLPEAPDLWLPAQTDFAQAPRNIQWVRVIALLQEGAAWPQAQAEMDAIAARIRQESSDYEVGGVEFEVHQLYADVVRGSRPALLILVGVVSFVLLIACSNVAGMNLARVSARRSEFAIRTALGAGRLRLLRQLLTEAFLLSAAGAALGLLATAWALNVLRPLYPPTLPRKEAIAMDGAALGFAFLLALATPLVTGVTPLWQVLRTRLESTLRQSSQAGRAPNPMRNVLVALTVALSALLLIGGGLMVRTFRSLQRVEAGFRPESVLTFRLNLTGPYSEDPRQVMDFYQQLRENLSAVPGVSEVGAISHLPLAGRVWSGPYLPGETISEKEWEETTYRADKRIVTPTFFAAVGTRLLKGRVFSAADSAESRDVVVIDQMLARKVWGDENPIGKRLRATVPSPNGYVPNDVEVVGVVEHLRLHNLRETVREQLYFPHAQAFEDDMTVVVKTTQPTARIIGPIQVAVWRLDPNLPLGRVRRMDTYVSDNLARPRFSMALINLLAVLAAALSAVGLYTLIALVVRQRTHEIGIRMALGAQRSRILRMVLGQGFLLAGAGLAVGLLGAVGLTRYLESLLFGVSATDPLTFISISVLLLSVSLLACYLPARRATRVDPMVALRYE